MTRLRISLTTIEFLLYTLDKPLVKRQFGDNSLIATI